VGPSCRSSAAPAVAGAETAYLIGIMKRIYYSMAFGET
jgi:hypothetical protein